MVFAHKWFSGRSNPLVQWTEWCSGLHGSRFQRPQLFNDLRSPVVFSSRNYSMAPVAQVVLWFPAPVVNGRGNSLVLWFRGFPWFLAAHWFLWLDWAQCSGSSVQSVVQWQWLPGYLNPLLLYMMLGMAQGNAPFFLLRLFRAKWSSGPNPFLV